MVPYDGDPNYLGVTGYSLKRLCEQLAKLEAKEIVVVLDSCFSGAGGRSVLTKGARPLVMTAPRRPCPRISRSLQPHRAARFPPPPLKKGTVS